MPSKTSLLPSPEQLQHYYKVDPGLPELIVQAATDEARWEFWYAVASLAGGVITVLSAVGGFVYLVMNNHPQAAGSLLGTGVLGLIQGFIRARLRLPESNRAERHPSKDR